MLKGVRADESFFKKGILLEEYRLSPDVLGPLELILPFDTPVSVPYQEAATESSPYRLRLLRGKYYLTTYSDPIPVKVIPHPRFYGDLVREGVRIHEVASCHGRFVSLHLCGHRYLQPYLGGLEPFNRNLALSVDEVVALLERVKRDHPIEVVALSSWDAGSDDGGILRIEPYIRAIKSAFNVLLFVEVHPPKSASLIDVTQAMGADSVCYHLGRFDPTLPDQSRMEENLSVLRHAVNVFPAGSVLAHLTLGDQPLETVYKDIEMLSSLRVLPVMTGQKRADFLGRGITVPALAGLFGFIYAEAKKNRIPLHYFAKLSPFVAPIEGRFFSEDTPRLQLIVHHIYRSLVTAARQAWFQLRRRFKRHETRNKA